MSFTRKQRKFIEAFLVDGNGPRAARAAGYAPASATKEADRLLKHEKVAAEIARRRAGGDAPVQVIATDPLSYMLGTMRNTDATDAIRMRAAIAAARYVHVKPGVGKKETALRAASQAVNGRFKPGSAPNVFPLKTKKDEE